VEAPVVGQVAVVPAAVVVAVVPVVVVVDQAAVVAPTLDVPGVDAVELWVVEMSGGQVIVVGVSIGDELGHLASIGLRSWRVAHWVVRRAHGCRAAPMSVHCGGVAQCGVGVAHAVVVVVRDVRMGVHDAVLLVVVAPVVLHQVVADLAVVVDDVVERFGPFLGYSIVIR
jgi:hypothetical protein